MLTDAILARFESILGSHTESGLVIPFDARLTGGVWLHSWRFDQSGTTWYLTAGFSQLALPGVGRGEPAELLLAARGLVFDTAASLIRAATVALMTDGVPLRTGDTIALDEPIDRSQGLGRLLVTGEPVCGELRTIDFEETLIRIVSLVPIFDSEFGLIRSREERSFWDAVRQENADLCDMTRKALTASHEFVVQRVRGPAH